MPASRPVSLTYEIIPSKFVTYEDLPESEYVSPPFVISVGGSNVTFGISDPTLTSEEARHMADEYLRQWVMDIGLSGRPNEFEFRHSATKVETVIAGKSSEVTTFSASVSLDAAIHIVRSDLPYPDPCFEANPEVSMLYHRYLGFCDGREPLLGMAYFILSYIESTAGGRRAAAQNYSISYDILSELGRLSSTRGDIESARKMGRQNRASPLTNVEKNWLKQVVPKIIRQLGINADNRAQLSLQDFPDLTLP